MSLNIRKFLCPFFKKGNWLYRTFDCKRYEPEPIFVPVVVCFNTNLLPNRPYCPNERTLLFEPENVPTEKCKLHQKPMPTYSKLPLEITVPELEKATGELKAAAPAFLKPIMINTGEVSNSEVEAYVEKITEDPEASGPAKFHGNYSRHLIGCGFYDAGTLALLENFFETISGRYDLYEVREQWKDTFLTRAESFTKRRWTIELDPFNNSELHNFSFHPLHRDNNHGYKIPELGGSFHSTHTKSDSFKGAFRLWDHFGIAWKGYLAERRIGIEAWKLLTAAERLEETERSTIDEMTSADHEDMNQNRAVREFVHWYLPFIINLCRDNLDMTYVKFGANEWRSRTQTHLNIWKPIYDAEGIPKKDRITSFDPIDWYKSGQAVFDQFLGCLHFTYAWNLIWFWTTEGLQDRIFDLDEVIAEILPADIKFMFSADGLGWGEDFPKDYDKQEETTFRCLKYGLGHEVNSDFKKKLSDIDHEVGRSVGRGLSRYVSTL